MPAFPILPTKTTRTAQYLHFHHKSVSMQSDPITVRRDLRKTYPALAAKTSCLLALVNSDKTALKTSVATSSTPMHSTFERVALKLTEKW